MTVESGRLSRLASSRSATHKASTPCLLSGKVCLVLVMIYIYFFYGNGRLAHHSTPNLEDQALQYVKVSTGIASRVIKAHKSPYHVIKRCNNDTCGGFL